VVVPEAPHETVIPEGGVEVDDAGSQRQKLDRPCRIGKMYPV